MGKKMGRPIVHSTEQLRLAAQAQSAKEYRARRKALKTMRRDIMVPLTSSIIDLSTNVSDLVTGRVK